MLSLQLPKEGAKSAGERRHIALLPQIYRLWSAACRSDVLAWRKLETFDLAYLTEERSAAGQHQAVVLLAVSEGVQALVACPLAVVMRLICCIPSSSGRLGVPGSRLRQVLASLTSVNMRVNALKTFVLCNGSVTKRNLWKVWRAGRLLPVQILARTCSDLRAVAGGALGKGAALRRSGALELMAHGGPTGDRAWPRPHRLDWIPIAIGWRQGEPHFTWHDADYKVKWDSALHLCEGVADMRLDFQRRKLLDKLDGQSQKDRCAHRVD
eukprot:4762723-Amphidinium_carterae.1